MFFKKKEIIKVVHNYGVRELEVEALEGIEFVHLRSTPYYIWIIDRENKELIPSGSDLKEIESPDRIRLRYFV